MKKAIIHIGGHKTGSTSIQKSLFDSSPLLSKQGICYPLELTSGELSFFGQHSLAWNLLNRQGLPKQLQINKALETLNLLKDQHLNLLFSSEEFAWFDDYAVALLKKELIDFDIYVVIYVRRQDEAALALYQTDIVHYGETRAFDLWVKSRDNIFDYFSIIKKWKEATNGKIIVRPYDRTKLVNGDVINDFETTLNNIFEQNITLIKPKQELNKSLPSSVTSIIRYYNTQPSKKIMASALIRLGKELSSLKTNKSFDLVPPSLRQSILKRFHQGNLELSKEYLGLNEIWFNDVITESDAEWEKNNPFNGSSLLALVNETLDFINFLKSNT